MTASGLTLPLTSDAFPSRAIRCGVQSWSLLQRSSRRAYWALAADRRQHWYLCLERSWRVVDRRPHWHLRLERDWLWTAGHIGICALSGRGRLGVGEGSVDFLIEHVDQASRRGLRSANAIRLLILARTGYTMTTVAAIAMARIIGAPPHRIGSFYLACGAIGSNIQTRSKEPVNVSNSLHRPARPSSRQAAPAGAAFLSLARCQ